jgi:hypothetical protein
VNGRTAKKLRKKARQETVGKPAVTYKIHKVTRNIMLGECTRAQYKKLKKEAKRLLKGSN